MSLTEKLIRTLVAVVMVPGLLAGASWAAPVTTNLQVNYDPSSMVGSGANSNPDWNDTTASAVHMDNLPTFTLNASPTGAPAAITQSFTITGGQANNVDQVAGGADDWDEALAGNYQQYSASLEFWLQPANITQDRRVIYEIGGGSGMGMFQDDQWLEFAVTTNGREWVAVDLTNVPGLGDISSDWFQALGVIDKVNKKVSLYINGVHIADSNLGGSANGVAIKRGSSTTDTEWGSLNWSGGDAQALGDASTNANVAPNKNMGGYGNSSRLTGPPTTTTAASGPPGPATWASSAFTATPAMIRPPSPSAR